MSISSDDIRLALNAYLSNRQPDSRYASFDYCYNHFQRFRRSGHAQALADPANLQRSCLELGFYLASWGMLRGSSDLLNKSYHYLKPLMSEIACAPPELWDLDIDVYGESTWDLLNGFRRKILASMPLRSVPSEILVTKIMLGVFGNVPAFDGYFKKGFGCTTFGRKAIAGIRKFYLAHQTEIDNIKIPTLEFTGGGTKIRYPIAKVIDMIFFTLGQRDYQH